MTPDLTVVIPYYNRADTVPLVLESVARARGGLQVEVVLVDDGSALPAAMALRDVPHPPDVIIRQENRGLLFARLRGLEAARGRYVLFLDSDDLVGAEKFTAQLAAMDAAGAQVSYSDTGTVELRTPYDTIVADPGVSVAEDTTDSAVFFIRVQPPPHSPIFATAWLQRITAAPLFPPHAAYNPVAEIWFYHVAAPHAARVVKVSGAHTLIGRHAGARLTNHWEKLGVASLGVMEGFDRACPRLPATHALRQLVGVKAFGSWRALPRGFSAEFDHRLLGVWRRQFDGHPDQLGGRVFRWLRRALGTVGAARLIRRLSRPSYASCRTSTDAEVSAWLAQLPSA